MPFLTSFRAYDIIDIVHSSISSAIAVLLHVHYDFGLNVNTLQQFVTLRKSTFKL